MIRSEIETAMREELRGGLRSARVTALLVRGAPATRERYETQKRFDIEMWGRAIEEKSERSLDLLDPGRFILRCTSCGACWFDMRPRLVLNARVRCARCKGGA